MMASAICESANAARPARLPATRPSLRGIPGARSATPPAGTFGALARRPVLRGAAASALIATAYVAAIVGMRWLIAP
jgi:hypothetical protein